MQACFLAGLHGRHVQKMQIFIAQVHQVKPFLTGRGYVQQRQDCFLPGRSKLLFALECEIFHDALLKKGQAG